MMLDYPHNDIFIHIDKKCKNFDFLYFSSLTKYSKIIFTKKRIDVKWGTQSQVKTEMTLFKTAYTYNPDGYSYYHLISGVDLPIKTQEYIHSYLEDKNENFLYYKENISIFDKARISRYRLRIHNKKMLEIFNIIQDKLNVDRMKNSKYEIKKGYNWASLTNDTVKLLLKHKKDIYKITFLSVCADEVYKQTILHYYNAKIFKNPDGKTDDLRLVGLGTR